MQKCQALTKPPSAERLAQILQHHGLRLSEMFFSEFSWVPGRLYWQNVDGSHHIAAARFMAIQLGQPVSLTGQLTSYQLNSTSFSQLLDEWDLFLIPAGLVYGGLRDAQLRVQCPFGISPRQDGKMALSGSLILSGWNVIKRSRRGYREPSRRLDFRQLVSCCSTRASEPQKSYFYLMMPSPIRGVGDNSPGLSSI